MMSKPGKWFSMFFKNPETRQRVFAHYVHWKNIYSLGESEIGFIRHCFGFQSVAVYYLMAEKISDKLGLYIPVWLIVSLIIVAPIIKAVVYITAGVFWDRNKYVQIQQQWNNVRNLMLQNIEKAVAKKE